MNVLVTGEKDFTDIEYMRSCLIKLYKQGKLVEPWNLVCLMYVGADECAYTLAYEHQLGTYECPSDEDVLGPDDGRLQNMQAEILADVLVIVGEVKSQRLNNLAKLFMKHNKPIYRM